MQPPFTLTPKILNLVSEISVFLGKYEGLQAPLPQPKLRKHNQIRTIQGSLAIEGNALDLDKVTAILEKKRVIGPKKDILEVQNALELYDHLHRFSPTLKKDLLRAHGILMKGLTLEVGKYRSGGVGILKGSKVSHVAPPALRVPGLIDDLIRFLKQKDDLSPLIKACIFHYEFEFIHPFSDGNGRLGRFWQHLILVKYHPGFEFIPFESLVKERQDLYYRSLEASDKKGESTLFIEFSLEVLRDALKEFLDHLKPAPETPGSRLETAKNEFGQRKFSRKEYLQLFKTISTATASRDLALGVSQGILEKFGTQATARYQFSGKNYPKTQS